MYKDDQKIIVLGKFTKRKNPRIQSWVSFIFFN